MENGERPAAAAAASSASALCKRHAVGASVALASVSTQERVAPESTGPKSAVVVGRRSMG